MEQHKRYAYALLATLVFRILWGVIGSSTSRFKGWLRSPKAIAVYASQLHKRNVPMTLGHNPLGALSAIGLLAVMALQIILGLFAIDVDGFDGGPIADYIDFDLARAFADAHELTFNILLALIVLHLAAIVYYRVWRRQNLLAPMLHGRTVLSESTQYPRFYVLRLCIGVCIALGLFGVMTYYF